MCVLKQIMNKSYVDDAKDHGLLSCEEMTRPVAMRFTLRALQQELSSAKPTPLLVDEYD